MNEEDRANELYWNSTQSVNSIASELGLSKGRLYGALRPLPAGRSCPECGAELVYKNRTARDRAAALCLVCEGKGGSPAATSTHTSAETGMNGWPSAPPGTARILVGAAIGGAAGLLIMRWLRR